MKIRLFAKGSIAAVAAIALSLGACKKATDSNADADKPKGEGKPPAPAPAGDPAPEPVADPAPDPEPAPAPAPAGDSVAKQLNGYWAPTSESVLDAMKKEMAAAGQELDEATLAQLTPMIQMIAGTVALHLEDGASTMVNPDGVDLGKYTISKTDPATGAFTAEVTEGDGDPETGEGIVSGDTLSMTKGGIKMDMVRITKAEFEKRKASAGAPPAGLPPGLVPPDLNIPDIAPDIDPPEVNE